MDSFLSVPILYLLLIFTQNTFADSLSGGRKLDESSMVLLSPQHEHPGVNRATEQQQAILRFLLLAAQNNNRGNMLQFRPTWGEKRAKTMGSEFLGKKRGMGSEFLGKKRGMGSEFLGKKRGMGSEFLEEKRGMGSEFLGKRSSFDAPVYEEEQIEKRAKMMGSEFLGKRGFFGKRRLGSEFLGKRAGSEVPANRDYEIDSEQHPVLLNDPTNWINAERTSSSDRLYYPMQKRLFGTDILKIKSRGRLGSEFLGRKRSTGVEMPQPYLQATGQYDVGSESESSSTEEN